IRDFHVTGFRRVLFRSTRLLAICILAWSVATGLAAFAQSFAVLAISRLGVGIGEGAAQPGANSIIFDTFPRNRRGTAMAAMGIEIGRASCRGSVKLLKS